MGHETSAVASTPVTGRDLVEIIELALSRHLPQCRPHVTALNDALRYSVFPGGKRLRPVLTVLGARIFEDRDCGSLDERVLRAACAVEFVHTSSLILDDMPCMDDAGLRRGNPALHLVYGEDAALLAGIALLTKAYALFGHSPELILEATDCIGVDGMVGGQALDLCGEPGEATLAERNRKTSALMRLAATAGALALGASREETSPLAAFGQSLGQAYQIYDDMVDAGLSSECTGKTAQQDSRHSRPSHATSLDMTACFAELAGLIEVSRESLISAYGESEGVRGLMGFIDGLFSSKLRGLPGRG